MISDTQLKHLKSVDVVLDWALSLTQDLLFDLDKDSIEYKTLDGAYIYISKNWQRISILRHKLEKEKKYAGQSS